MPNARKELRINQKKDSHRRRLVSFSVGLNRHGWPRTGTLVGHRIHPSRRMPGPWPRFDATGWDEINRGLTLPALSLDGAPDSLGTADSLQHRRPTHPNKPGYSSSRHWKYPSGLRNHLKAMTACSIGQIAVGVNGINGCIRKVAATDSCLL